MFVKWDIPFSFSVAVPLGDITIMSGSPGQHCLSHIKVEALSLFNEIEATALKRQITKALSESQEMFLFNNPVVYIEINTKSHNDYDTLPLFCRTA